MRGKYLSFLLRHDPKTAVDEEGWIEMSELPLPKEEIEEIVRTDSKSRFQVHGTRVRAVQGHSKFIIGFLETIPPAKLYHGSNLLVEPIIKVEGLKKMKRHHVHLSENYDEAIKIAFRKRKGVVIFEIDSQAMVDDGFKFYKAENGVWLVDEVPVIYLTPTYPECF